MKKIKFSISDDLQARLHSLIATRVKDVRTDDQFLSYVTHPINAGGIGLSNDQSQELLQIVKDVWHIVGQRSVKQFKTTVNEKASEAKPPEAKGEGGELKKEVTKLNVSLPRNNTERKPMLHDIVKPKLQTDKKISSVSEKHSIGPIEEIKNFSLVDLRRMGDNTVDNFKKILEKFKVLKKDSIILYFEATRAWYESPLYKQYQGLLFQSVESGSKIKDLAVGGEVLTWEEIEGVIELESNFS